MEDINFWDEDVFEDFCANELNDLENVVEPLSTQILESCLNPESFEVSVMVAILRRSGMKSLSAKNVEIF